MNTGLGLSFLRIVNEEGLNGWSQVYARVPFDESEIRNKGALFGVVFGFNKEDWAEKDAELMGWVEEYFNGVDVGSDLADFFGKWKERYPELSGAWFWVVESGDKREILMAKQGDIEIILRRKNKEFDFSAGMVEGKVARGKIENEDRFVLSTPGLSDRSREKKMVDMDEESVLKMNELIKNQEFAAASLILDFKKLIDNSEEEAEKPVVVTEVKEETVQAPPVQQVASDELAEEKYVGRLGIKERVANFWVRISTRKQRVRGDDFVERKDFPKRKRWAITLGVVFLGLLLVSLITGSLKIKREAEQKKWQEFSEPIEKSLSEAKELVRLNPSGARKLVEDSKSVFQAKSGDFLQGKHAKDLGELQTKIDLAWTAVSGEKESQLEEVARIDLVRQGFKGDRLALIKDRKLLVLDGQMGVVATVDLSNKDIKIAAGKGEGLGWLDVSGDVDKVLVMNSNGVRNAINGQDLVKFDAAVIKAIAMGRFGGNIYLLDQGNKEIFKYAAVAEGYGERTRWLKQDQGVDIVPMDLAIDSDIWLVSETGAVEKFRRGSKESFSISGLAGGMKISKIAVEQEGERLALLDNTSGVVAVCSKKTGVCDQLLKAEKIREVKDIEFDAQGNLLVLLPGVIGVLK